METKRIRPYIKSKYPYYALYEYTAGQLKQCNISAADIEQLVRVVNSRISRGVFSAGQYLVVNYTAPYKSKITAYFQHIIGSEIDIKML